MAQTSHSHHCAEMPPRGEDGRCCGVVAGSSRWWCANLVLVLGVCTALVCTVDLEEIELLTQAQQQPDPNQLNSTAAVQQVKQLQTRLHHALTELAQLRRYKADQARKQTDEQANKQQGRKAEVEAEKQAKEFKQRWLDEVAAHKKDVLHSLAIKDELQKLKQKAKASRNLAPKPTLSPTSSSPTASPSRMRSAVPALTGLA